MKNSFSIIKKKVILLLLLSMFLYKLTGQEAPENIPSPTVTSLAKYGDVSISMYTGTPNISIPIYSMKSLEITMPISYEYDANGNMTKDANKGIYRIAYNSFNLPTDIFSKNGSWNYSYDGNGNKVFVYSQISLIPVTVPESQAMDKVFSKGMVKPIMRQLQRAYSDGYVYEYSPANYEMELSRINIPNGYITFDLQNKCIYNFYVTDNIGNNRLVVNSKTGKMIQVNSYYPYGGLYDEEQNESSQSWRYGNKELDRTFDLYDFLTRWYDPSLCRFLMVDAMAEKIPWISPYAYCANNPINAFDPNGQYLIYLYTNQNNEKTMYYYQSHGEEGYDFYDRNGNKFGYDDPFYGHLKEALGKLCSKTYGSILVNGLIDSPNGIFIKKSLDDHNHIHAKEVEWNPKNEDGGPDTKGGKKRNAFIGLGHELAHMLDPNVNKFTDVWLEYDGIVINEGEKYATYWENLLRSEHGFSLRKYYVDDKTGSYNDTLLIDSKNRNLFYDSKINVIGDKQYITIFKR